MICPTCKAQNIDAAKFCGGCGTPLAAQSAAPAAAPSAMVTCAQGHVYSSVYNACPYCPKTDRPAAADFATRIEPLADTTMETPAVPMEPLATLVQPMPSYNAPATMVEPPPASRPPAAATVVEPPPAYSSPATVVEPMPPMRPAAPATVVEPPPPLPQYNAPATMVEPMQQPITGQIRRDYATVVEPSFHEERTGALPESGFPASTPLSAPPPVQAPPAPATIVQPFAPPPTAPPPAIPSAAPPAAPVANAPVRTERRTVIVPNENIGSGRLVGWLVNFTQSQDGIDYRLRAGRNVIGANPSCDIVIQDEAVSGVHASIVWRGGRCFIKDELSSNGTYLNGAEVAEPEQLQGYDQVRVGNVVLTFIALEINP